MQPSNNEWDPIKRIDSDDQNVSKFVFSRVDAVAEAVLYKYPTYEERTVICCSTQSGCPVGCRFCGAGDHFVRSLNSMEIVDQVTHLIDATGINPKEIKKLQVMFMSMGECMYNVSNLCEAIRELYVLYPNAKLLISTSAPCVPEWQYERIRDLSVEIPTVGLQFSVHESTDEARRALIPSCTLDLEGIALRGKLWHVATGRRPFFNYCVHPGNNSVEDVKRLNALFDPEIWEATLSVICERDEHVAAANERQRTLASEFASLMLAVGYNVRVFNPAGQDTIGGGCGQLWYVQDWMKKHSDLVKLTRGHGLPKVHTPR